jgi:hypothetical protein
MSFAILNEGSKPLPPEYRILPEDVEYDDLYKVYLPKKFHIIERDASPIELTLEGKIGGGGLGQVFEYRGKSVSVALKVTIVNINTNNEDYPSESHHYTEAAAPHRLFESRCASYFADFFVPAEDGVNAWLVGCEGEIGYTVGKQDPVRSFDPLGENPESREIFRLCLSDYYLFTVMKKASGSLATMRLFPDENGYEIASRALRLADGVQECLGPFYFYKDIKLDQVLVFPSNSNDGSFSLRLGDFGNLCHRKEDRCELGYFDDPLSYVYAPSVVDWRWVMREDENVNVDERLEWQKCTFLCEFACAFFETETAGRENNTVYKLAPHRWQESYTEPDKIIPWFDEVEEKVERSMSHDHATPIFKTWGSRTLDALRRRKKHVSDMSMKLDITCDPPEGSILEPSSIVMTGGTALTLWIRYLETKAAGSVDAKTLSLANTIAGWDFRPPVNLFGNKKCSLSTEGRDGMNRNADGEVVQKVRVSRPDVGADDSELLHDYGVDRVVLRDIVAKLFPRECSVNPDGGCGHIDYLPSETDFEGRDTFPLPPGVGENHPARDVVALVHPEIVIIAHLKTLGVDNFDWKAIQKNRRRAARVKCFYDLYEMLKKNVWVRGFRLKISSETMDAMGIFVTSKLCDILLGGDGSAVKTLYRDAERAMD